MSHFWIGVLIGLTALGARSAETNVVVPTPAPAAGAPDAKDPVEQEYQKLLAEDDAAQTEVDKWLRDDEEFAAKGAGVPPGQRKRRIQERFDRVVKAYEDFLQRHPNHVRARVAYASLLGDIKDEDEAQVQLEKALAIDTNNPAIYNNLANIYGHIGPVRKAFDFYARAIELNPLEPVYYHNFGTTVFLFRTDAMEHFKIDEGQVFAKAFNLYSNAMRLDPQNFPLASDVAQTYYGIQPMRTEEALRAWTNALHLAHDEIEREGVYVHFARIKTMAGRYDEARVQLQAITNGMYADLRRRLDRNLVEREKEARGTNAAPAEPPAQK